MKKQKLPNCKIEYLGGEYNTKVRGDDETGAGGLWDLAGTFARKVTQDSSLFEDDDKISDYELILLRDTIQDVAYNLIKYSVLPGVEKRLAQQKGSEM